MIRYVACCLFANAASTDSLTPPPLPPRTICHTVTWSCNALHAHSPHFRAISGGYQHPRAAKIFAHERPCMPYCFAPPYVAPRLSHMLSLTSNSLCCHYILCCRVRAMPLRIQFLLAPAVFRTILVLLPPVVRVWIHRHQILLNEMQICNGLESVSTDTAQCGI